MSKVFGVFHLKLQPDVDVQALEKFLKEEVLPYWEQLPGLSAIL